MWQAIAAIVQSILGALFAALRVRRLDKESDRAKETVAVDEATIATAEAQDEIVDAVNNVQPPANRGQLLDELQRSTTVSRSDSRKRRPF